MRAKVRSLAARLTWPRRAKRHEHDFLGPSQFWTSRCGRYRVERFPRCSGRYLAMWRDPRLGGTWTLLSRHQKLGPAQRACERHAGRVASIVNAQRRRK